MSRKKPNRGPCVFCHARRKLTRDHVPPFCLFPKGSRSSTLVTVPACNECNLKSSGDDEYFRLILSVRDDLSGHPEVEKLREVVGRSFQKPTKRGFAQAFANSVVPVSLRTPAGIYLPQRHGIRIDLDRLNKILGKIVRGLFWKEFDTSLPKTHGAGGILVNDLPAIAPRVELAAWAKEMELLMRGSTFKPIAKGVFSYRYNHQPDDQNFSVWWLTFYQKVACCGFTAPKGSAPGLL